MNVHITCLFRFKNKQITKKRIQTAYIFLYQLLIEMSKYLRCIVHIWFCSNV